MDPEELLKQIQEAMNEGLLVQLYRAASVSPDEVLKSLRQRGLEVFSLGEIWRVPTPLLDAAVDEHLTAKSRSTGLVSGAFSAGGLVTLLPELIWQVTTLLRLGQRVALTYGEEVTTPKGRLDLWQNLAAALSIKVDLEGVESDLKLNLPMVVGTSPMRDPMLVRLAEMVMFGLAMRMASQAIRLVPMLGAGLGGLRTYRQTRQYGEQFKTIYRNLHQLRHVNLSELEMSQETAFTLVAGGPVRS